MLKTIFHSGICIGEADLHDSLSIEITVGIFDLLDKLTQSVLSRCRRIESDAAALNESVPVNRLRVYRSHGFNAHHVSYTSCLIFLSQDKRIWQSILQ